MSIWRWLIGDTDEPLGPESERGLFNHFNRPESLPWPPDHPDYTRKSLKPLTDKPKPRPKQFRPPVSDPTDQDYQWDSITGDRENHSSAAYYEEEQRRFFAEERRKHIAWLNRQFPTAVFVDPAVRSTRGSAHGIARVSTTEPHELKPTVGYYNSPPPRDYPNAPTIPVPYAVRPAEVTEALKIGDTHPDVYEYLVHLESHFARTHHHGK